MIAPGLEAHARALLVQELQRRSGVLGALPEKSRIAVHDAAEQTVAAFARSMVDVAAAEPAVAAAIRSIYGLRP